FRVQSGFIPIVGPAADGQAEVMDTTTTPPQEDQISQVGPKQVPGPQPRPRALTRRRDDRMLAGVASGIAGYLGVDALFVRIAFAVLTIVGGAGIPLYVACWLLIPDEGAARSIATDFTNDVQAWRN
ncbi:MAG TPA: PspC domain-containing protein, partial [Streptosporangiaceae bacterium]